MWVASWSPEFLAGEGQGAARCDEPAAEGAQVEQVFGDGFLRAALHHVLVSREIPDQGRKGGAELGFCHICLEKRRFLPSIIQQTLMF